MNTWYTNIDQVPVGRSIYTAFIAQRASEDGEYVASDEIDFVAKRNLLGLEAQTAAYDSYEFKSFYDSLARGGNDVVVAVVDQLEGEVVFNVCAEYGVEYSL